jgi:LCP family protein required for cell wall assembly
MSRVLLGLVSLVLIVTLSGCADLAEGAQGGSNEAPQKVAKVEPTPAPTPPPIRVDDLLGSDGRLTVLVLGSDQRAGVVGTRTDAIIVATINPKSGQITMVSLPRDTVSVPIAPGVTYPERINSLYAEYERETGKAKKALKRVKRDLSYAFGTEIDYYAMVEFDGLQRLVNNIGGIKVELDEPLVDPTLHIGKNGLKLKKGVRELDGQTALAFARSRHSDSDYGRSRRQHQVLTAAAVKVRNRGEAPLASLVEVASKKIVTDMPLRGAPAMLELARKAKLGEVRSIVLEPGRFARQLPGSYTTALRVLEVQKMFDKQFKAVR